MSSHVPNSTVDADTLRNDILNSLVAIEETKYSFNKMRVACEMLRHFIDNLPESGKPHNCTIERNVLEYLPDLLNDHVVHVNTALEHASERMYQVRDDIGKDVA